MTLLFAILCILALLGLLCLPSFTKVPAMNSLQLADALEDLMVRRSKADAATLTLVCGDDWALTQRAIRVADLASTAHYSDDIAGHLKAAGCFSEAVWRSREGADALELLPGALDAWRAGKPSPMASEVLAYIAAGYGQKIS